MLPLLFPTALTCGNNSCTAVINLHQIQKLLKQHSPFLLARQPLDCGWDPEAEQRQTPNSKVSPQLLGMALFANSSAWRGSYWSGPVPAPTARNTHFLFILPNWAGFTLWEVLSQTRRQQTDVNTRQSATAQQQKNKVSVRTDVICSSRGDIIAINQSTTAILSIYMCMCQSNIALPLQI